MQFCESILTKGVLCSTIALLVSQSDWLVMAVRYSYIDVFGLRSNNGIMEKKSKLNLFH